MYLTHTVIVTMTLCHCHYVIDIMSLSLTLCHCYYVIDTYCGIHIIGSWTKIFQDETVQFLNFEILVNP